MGGIFESGYFPDAGLPKDQFIRRAAYFKRFRDNPYQIIRFDLTQARDKILIRRAGDLIKIIHASSDDAQIDIRLNYDNIPVIQMKRYRKIETYFEEIFITNTAQEDEWVDVLIAVKEWFDISDFFVG